MTTPMKLSIGCIVSLLFVGGCATSKPALEGQINSDLGVAVKSNIARHAVAPTAAQKANTFIPANPERARKARQNYKDNNVPEPKLTTQ